MKIFMRCNGFGGTLITFEPDWGITRAKNDGEFWNYVVESLKATFGLTFTVLKHGHDGERWALVKSGTGKEYTLFEKTNQ
jgi:hypothetical protein